jgi:hypothetical protein
MGYLTMMRNIFTREGRIVKIVIERLRRRDRKFNPGGGVLPNIQNRPNIQSDSEITRQPEDEDSQDEDEGAETAGPLT